MPQLSDKQLDDLYAFAGDAETAGRCLLHTLNSMFYDYRLAAHHWDHARGLLSAEDLDGADAETESRREQMRARARGQSAEARASSVPGSGNGQGRAVYELPCGLEDLVGRARDGVTALWSLWGAHCTSPEEFPDQKFAASLKFCIDGIDTLLEKADQRIEAAIER
jgi:hypothetical protein